jgi:hypothetical protein
MGGTAVEAGGTKASRRCRAPSGTNGQSLPWFWGSVCDAANILGARVLRLVVRGAIRAARGNCTVRSPRSIDHVRSIIVLPVRRMFAP